jgi:tetratricopeptide (TPR) repeat protein
MPDVAELLAAGLAEHRAGRAAAARALYEAALARDPGAADAHHLLGRLDQRGGDRRAALARFDRAIALDAGPAAFHHSRARVLLELGQCAAALESAERAIVRQPAPARHHCTHATALIGLRRFVEAVAGFDRAIARDPALAEAHLNRGVALLECDAVEAALESLDRALALHPDDALAHDNRGTALSRLGRVAEAAQSHARALARDPGRIEAQWNLGLCQLRLGDLPRGWEGFESRLRVPGFAPRLRRFRQPIWRGGSDLAGRTILLHDEQGFGDTIQFARYVPMVAALGARVVLAVQPQLARLFAGFPGVAHHAVVGAELPPFHRHCPLPSLPAAFGTRLDTIPWTGPYLAAPPALAAAWAARLGPRRRPRIGLVWAGGARPAQPELAGVNARRNLPLAALAALAGVPADFVSLQKGAAAEAELAARQRDGWAGPVIADPVDAIDDFADTAALIAALDLVVAVDTAVAHLAGAMGKPVWLLSRFDSCWRWMLDRDDSPWYPTLRLFRQVRPGDWGEVMGRVVVALRAPLARWRADADPVWVGGPAC